MRFVYMLRCADGSLYIGETENLDERVAPGTKNGELARSRRHAGRWNSSTLKNLQPGLRPVAQRSN